MIESRNFDILDFVILILKKKKLLISITIFSLIISYVSIYFLIPPQYDSRALIVISGNEEPNGLTSIMRSLSNLPISIPGLKTGTDTDVFTTIIYSRTNLVNVINKFDLYKEYGFHTMEQTIKELSNNITAQETKEGAYEIVVRNKSPKKAADMVNYIVGLLNKTLVDLNISKSRDNRFFLQKRYEDIKMKLQLAEDSLVYYQQKTGILFAEDQAKTSFEAYAKLEAEIASRQIQYSILSKLYGESSPLAEAAKITRDEYVQKLNEIKSGKEKSDVILALKNLPKSTMNYLKHYREVEIYNKMLTFIIPLYEQARFDEQKKVPVLKIIDKGIPAERKSFPPRTLLTLLYTLIILIITLTFLILKERITNSEDPKVKLLQHSLFRNKKK